MPFSILVFFSIENTKNIFRKVCHHTKECDNPHPEYCSGTAGCNSAGYTYNVPGSNCCSESGTQGLELGYGFVACMTCNMLILYNCTKCILKPMWQVCNLEEFGYKGHKDSCKSQKNQSGPSPDNIVNGAVDISYYFYYPFNHKVSSLFLSKYSFVNEQKRRIPIDEILRLRLR